MRVFVCETVSGGSFAGLDLPAELIAEGVMMRDALIGDLEDLPGVRVITTHDARLPPPPRGESRPVGPGEDVRSIWGELAAQADSCWPVAPECEGILQSLVEQMSVHNARVIACDEETLRLCASKLSTTTRLAAAGIAVIPSWGPQTVPPSLPGAVVIKPDDGAGAVDVRVFSRLPSGPYPEGVVIQSFIEGTASSLCLLCQCGRTHILSVNRQHVVEIDGRLKLSGLTVGALPIDSRLEALADEIGAALPGLHGIVGIDYLATETGPVVVEINPRLTTAYVGLRRSLGVNPMAFVAELNEGPAPTPPRFLPAHPVEIKL